jgi:hypothetical protein
MILIDKVGVAAERLYNMEMRMMEEIGFVS